MKIIYLFILLTINIAISKVIQMELAYENSQCKNERNLNWVSTRVFYNTGIFLLNYYKININIF
jgi:hypothetical protein